MNPVLPAGSSALLVECASEEVPGLHAAICAAGLPALADAIPGARTVLVRFAGAVPPGMVERLAALGPVDAARVDAPAITVPVVYDGEDLHEIAAITGLGTDEVIERHSAGDYTVAFCGFAPGFAYLTGLDPILRVPRRDSPRPRVPAGSVAIAADYSAVYPRSTPGGWRLLGRTDLIAFDPHREPPGLLLPGTRVRFTPVEHLRTGAMASAPVLAQGGLAALQVDSPGLLALVQDGGRPGHGALAVGPAGPFDRRAHALANRLVGNAADAPVIEALGGGLALTARTAVTVAVTGAAGPVHLDGRGVDRGSPLRMAPGQALRLGPPDAGLRSYIAVRGGLAVPLTLGSAARDTLAGLGPEPLEPGSLLGLADAAASIPVVDHAAVGAPPQEPTVRILPGPRRDWFDDAAWAALLTGAHRLGTADRIGLRLEGPSLERRPEARGRELPPEGMVPGAIQVPPDGLPVILGPDHPVTGGYPVIAVVHEDDLGLLAHLAPGSSLRFHS